MERDLTMVRTYKRAPGRLDHPPEGDWEAQIGQLLDQSHHLTPSLSAGGSIIPMPKPQGLQGLQAGASAEALAVGR